jgi:hypothetical protein
MTTARRHWCSTNHTSACICPNNPGVCAFEWVHQIHSAWILIHLKSKYSVSDSQSASNNASLSSVENWDMDITMRLWLWRRETCWHFLRCFQVSETGEYIFFWIGWEPLAGWFGCLLVLVELVIPPSESDECNATLLWAGWGRPLFR